MNEREAIYRLRVALLQCRNLMGEYSSPDGREIHAMEEADNVISHTSHFSASVEELTDWGKKFTTWKDPK